MSLLSQFVEGRIYIRLKMLRVLLIFSCMSYGLARDPICPLGEKSWAHPDCRKYYICKNGFSSIQQCNQGLLWNSITKACDFSDRVPECSGGARQEIIKRSPSIITTIFTPPNITRLSPLQSPTARRFVNLGMRTCLHNNRDGEVFSVDCNDGEFQNWVWRSDLTIRNSGTGSCLDTNGATVFTHSCNSAAAYQKWVSTTNIVFKNVVLGQCLECNEDGEVFLYYCNDRNNQKWTH